MHCTMTRHLLGGLHPIRRTARCETAPSAAGHPWLDAPIGPAYEDAWTDWAADENHELWDATADDGLG